MPTKRRIFRTLLVAKIVIISAVTMAWADGTTPIIDNDNPLHGATTIKLEELWRVGNNGDVFFGIPVRALSDDSGRVYVADQQLCQVFVFDSMGQQLPSLSRNGEGPGEVSSLVDMIMTPDGNLGLAELFPGQIVKVTPDNLPAGKMPVGSGNPEQGGFTLLTSVGAGGGQMIAGGFCTTSGENESKRTYFVVDLDENGHEIRRLAEDQVSIPVRQSVVHETDYLPVFSLVNTVGPNGDVYLPTGRDEYTISVFDKDGKPTKIIRRVFEPRLRDDDDRARVLALFQAWSAHQETKQKYDLEKYEQTIAALHVDSRERLWVRHSRSGHNLKDGQFLTLDVFDKDGLWLQEVTLECPGDPVLDGLTFIGDDRVLVISNFVLSRLARLTAIAAQTPSFGEAGEDRPIEVICYKLINK